MVNSVCLHVFLLSNESLLNSRSDSGERVVIVVNFSGTFLGKTKFSNQENKNCTTNSLLANYTIPHLPANGWWHEWTFDYDVEVHNNEVHLDIAEREAKILVYRGEDWQPAPPPPAESQPESNNEQANPPVESTPSQEQNAEPTQSETPTQ